MSQAIARALRWREMLENGTYATIAELVGVSSITISRWENGQNDPTELAWARIEEIQGLEPAHSEVPRTTRGHPPLDFGADPEAVAAVAEAARLSCGHLASPTFATE